MYRLALALIIGLALLVAGCTSAPPADSPAADATADGDATPAPTDGDEAPTETESAGDGDDGGVGNPGGATDLEALLPDEVNGIQLTKYSYDGGSLDEDTAGFSLEGLASAAGVTPDEVSLAVAADQANNAVTIFAIRIDGRSGEQAMDALIENDDTGLQEAVEEANVGGKDVLTAGGYVYLYAAGDVLFQVYAEGAAAEDALSQLP